METKNNIGNSIEKFSHKLGEEIGTIVGEVSHRSEDYVKTTRSYVRQNPIQSVAVAAVAGIAIGSLLTLMLRRNNK